MRPELPEWASAISFPGDFICHPFLEGHCTSILFDCQAEVATGAMRKLHVVVAAETGSSSRPSLA
jgi:hypothetical protein